MSMLDSTLAFFVRGLKLRSRELKLAEALEAAADLSHFFAVEINYKGTPIRLIVASSAAPDGFALNPRSETRGELGSAPSVVEQ